MNRKKEELMENVRVRVFSAIKDYQIEGQINGWLQELGNSIEIIQVLQSVGLAVA